jgi:cell wall-associated NlpC family hydrolase
MFAIEEVKILEPDFYLTYNRIKSKFNYYDGYRNNCSNTVKTFLSESGVDVSKVTAYADTVRNLGKIQFNPNLLQIGDIVAMGSPGDTWHVGVYMGNNKVLHQSASRGYTVGIYNDLHAFINHRSGFYYVRPNYPIQYILDDFFVAPTIG